MAGAYHIPDGNDEIKAEIPLIIEIIARTARWVHPDTFRALPVWCPWAARGRLVYEKTWQRPSTNTTQATGVEVNKKESNVRARDALIAALGVASPKPKNWTVCHVWGYDDPSFATENSIVKNPRYYSCVGNMV
jgi:hypothetical protein